MTVVVRIQMCYSMYYIGSPFSDREEYYGKR